MNAIVDKKRQRERGRKQEKNQKPTAKMWK
jgi:hypothetical protein